MSDPQPPPASLFDRLFPERPAEGPADFSASRRMLPVSVLGVGIGALSGVVALALLKLIALFTQLFFFQRLSLAAASPGDHRLGLAVVLVPVAGGLLIGLMARYGSDRIRGHGIPEAIEAILMRGSRVEPKVALLKPVSSAISIGSGGPFGAEGPIIMTGGAVGSLVAQGFHLTGAERKTLLVAGAAGGMTATFGTPLAAMLLAVELLLFEWKPRSFVPVALSCVAAAVTRQLLMPSGPLFHGPALPAFVGLPALLGCLAAGLAAGGLSAAMTGSVYYFEDFFQVHLARVHWMWWPMLGGLVVGLGGLLCPRALGVGYESIADLLGGQLDLRTVLLLFVVKWAIWSFALGSGTSGGVLAPLLMLGAALGTLEAAVLPEVAPGFWPLVSMGAVLGGTMRSPFTGIVFVAEVTHTWDAVLPLAVAVAVAHAFTVLVLRRSILTEKISRRGFHVSREYAVDPLELLLVREVMRTAADATPPPVDLAFTNETLREVTHRMAHSGVTCLAVVEREAPGIAVGVITLEDMLAARRRHLEEETRRDRRWPLSLVFTPWLRARK